MSSGRALIVVLVLLVGRVATAQEGAAPPPDPPVRELTNQLGARVASPPSPRPETRRPAPASSDASIPRPRTDGAAPDAPRAPEHEDPFAALAQPLSPAEVAALGSLVLDLGDRTIDVRARAAARIREQLGPRAAGPLLERARHEPDPERRFRERALVASLVHVPFVAQAHDCGWLGIRWTLNRTATRAFTVHVNEPIEDEPAARGGLRAGDEIVAWDGVALEDQEDFVDRVQVAPPGSVVALTVERKTAEQKVESVELRVTMGRRTEGTNTTELTWYHRDLATRRFRQWLEAWRKLRPARRS